MRWEQRTLGKHKWLLQPPKLQGPELKTSEGHVHVFVWRRYSITCMFCVSHDHKYCIHAGTAEQGERGAITSQYTSWGSLASPNFKGRLVMVELLSIMYWYQQN